MIYKSVTELIGHTPLMELCNIEQELSLHSRIFAKIEFFNPTGSIKDRAALSIIEDAEKRGVLKKGGVIVEATSGNTGIGLASIAAARGYKAIIIMPDTMSAERIKLMQAYGAEVILSDGSKGMAGSIEKLKEIKKQYPDAVEAGQFVNPANTAAHFNTTGPEIWKDTEGKVDIVVAGIGTGGTITGVAKYLKGKNPGIQIVGVEPESSPLLTKGHAGPHKIQGIGANFVPEILDLKLIDKLLTVKNEDAFGAARLLGKKEGIMVGISAGCAIQAAVETAVSEYDKNIVVILPDSGDRYMSTTLFGE